jgi:site-specific recombinase XerD
LEKPVIERSTLQEFVESSKRIYKINEELFKIDRSLDENNIYSIILRLRGFYIAFCLLERKVYSKDGFKKFLIREGINFEEVYDIYRKVKSGEKIRKTLSESESLKLLNLLEKEVKSYGEKRKETD